MKFGVREICNVVFKAKSDMWVGKTLFTKGQPVLYIDTATTSTLEGSSTTVYAQGGRGNARLIAWEGEKTVTFTVEDALISPIGFSILSGAGLFKDEQTKVHVHKTATGTITENGGKPVVDLSSAIEEGEELCSKAPVFVVETESDNSVTGTIFKAKFTDKATEIEITDDAATAGTMVFVDFYVVRESSKVSEIQITADAFSGNFYVEASTLFRDQSTGKDMPAEITFPNVKIQSNFSFQMAATGDPSTFSFVMDAFPDYTMFNKNKKAICVIQVVEDAIKPATGRESLMKHTDETTTDCTVNAYSEADKHELDSKIAEKFGITKQGYQIGYADSDFSDTDVVTP